MDFTSLFSGLGGGGGGTNSSDNSFGKSSATSSFDLGTGDVTSSGIDSNLVLIGVLGLGLVLLVVLALRK